MDNIYDNIKNFLSMFLEEYKCILDTLHNDQLYQRVLDIKTNELKYEKVEWLFMEAGFIKPEASIDAVLSIDNPNPELKYIQEIVGNDYSYRDKLILLCGCIEPYIYAQVGLDPNGNLKNDLDIKVDKSNKLDSNDYYLLMIYTVTAIIFKNFNNDLVPDKRLPHRNCILHSGTLLYSEEELKTAYVTLVAYIYLIYQYSIKITALYNF